jgi:hypothetical protein
MGQPRPTMAAPAGTLRVFGADDGRMTTARARGAEPARPRPPDLIVDREEIQVGGRVEVRHWAPGEDPARDCGLCPNCRLVPLDGGRQFCLRAVGPGAGA